MREYGHGGDIYGQKNILDFSASLNPVGMPFEIVEAVRRSALESSPYPDPQLRRLKEAGAARLDAPSQSLVFGNGASDLIFRICLGLKPRKALIEEPAFSEYQRALDLVGCEVFHHSQTRENGFVTQADSLTEAISCAQPDLIFIGCPSNPAGTMVDKEDMVKICDCAKYAGSVVVIDRSFIHFAEGEDEYFFIEETLKRDNVILLDSMTKIFAMAGLRLGFMIAGDKAICEAVENCLQPWPVSRPAEEAGIAAFGVGPEFFAKTKRYVAKERQFLLDGLNALGMETFRSEANYVFFRSPVSLSGLKDRGILLRNCGNYWSLDESYYRAAVRTHQENEVLMDALKEILKEKGETDG